MGSVVRVRKTCGCELRRNAHSGVVHSVETRLATCALVMIVTVGLLGAPATIDAQQSGPLARIGYLSGASPERDRPWLAAFAQGLGELGYSEGRNVVIERRWALGRFDTLPDLAAELVRLKIDVLVVTGAPAAHAAKGATSAIPIVMTNAADPVGTGLVASLARPGGNLTGLSDFNAGVVAKRLEFLKEVAPRAARIAVLLNPANPTNPLQLKLIQAARPTYGLTLSSFEAKGPDELDRLLATLGRERPEALIVLGDPMLSTHRRRILDFCVRNRVPATYSTREWVADGGLMSYGTAFEELFRRAAMYVDRVLKGTKPADLPIEQPAKFELVINLKTARALGLTIPPSLLVRADQVVE